MGDFNRNFDRKRSGRGRSDKRSGGYGGRSRDSGRRDSGRSRDSGRIEMHTVICDKCSNECEVPFKPTQGKPIYCSDCFKDKNREAGSRSEFGKPKSNINLDQVNQKLDRILKILESNVNKEEKPRKTVKKNIPEEPDIEEVKPKKAKKKIPELDIIEEEKPRKTKKLVLEEPDIEEVKPKKTRKKAKKE